MGIGKKIRKNALRLRVASPDEAPFREVLSVIGAMEDLGLLREECSAGFFPREPPDGTCVPCVVVKRGDKATTYRLENRALEGSQAEVEKRWREWIVRLLGADPSGGFVEKMFVKSPYNDEDRLGIIEAHLEKEGIL